VANAEVGPPIYADAGLACLMKASHSISPWQSNLHAGLSSTFTFSGMQGTACHTFLVVSNFWQDAGSTLKSLNVLPASRRQTQALS